MSALSNAKIRRGGIHPHVIGLTSNALPKANGSYTGVSVRYALLLNIIHR